MKKVKRGASGPEPERRVGVLTISVFRKWKHIRGRETVRPQRADNAVRGLIFIVRPPGKHHGTKQRINRKSVVEGKSVAVRVDIDRLRILKKKKKSTPT